MPNGLAANIMVKRKTGFTLDLELTIAPGETVCLLGPNGAGKSTAVAAIAGLVALDGGRIELHGKVLDDHAIGTFVPAEQRDVGVVFQDYLLFPHLTVARNVEFGIRSRGGHRDHARAEAGELLNRLDLTQLAHRRPSELSGGQKQRVALARALAIRPAILLLDEPLAALDVTTRARTRHALRNHLSDFEGPRLLITHDPNEAFLLADRIVVIEGGIATQIGSADDIRLRPRTQYAADLGGSNLLVGVSADGKVDVGGHLLTVADPPPSSDVLVTIPPSAISVHRSHPGGSPRNTWKTRIEDLERIGERARLLTGYPLPLTAEVTSAAVDALDFRIGDEVWLSIKATEIHVEPVAER